MAEPQITPSDPGAELVDEIDEHDRIVAVRTRAEVRSGHLRHRCVFIVVRSSAGDVLVHQRSMAKDLLPGWWDLAAGGVVASGEGYATAASRELTEELGIDSTMVELGPVSYDDGRIRLLGRAYEIVHDGPFTFVDGEITSTAWMSVVELHAAVANGGWMPDSAAVVLPLIS